MTETRQTPLAGVVPVGAAAPALVVVGALMRAHARKIDRADMEIVYFALHPIEEALGVGRGSGRDEEHGSRKSHRSSKEAA